MILKYKINKNINIKQKFNYYTANSKNINN